MMSFSCLPPHVKDLVFSRTSYKDLFETGRVCTEWFELTLRNYRPVLKDGEGLLQDLHVFFVQQTNEEPGSWYDLLKLTTFDAARITSKTSEEFVAALKKHQPGICRLLVDRMDSTLKYWDLMMSLKLESIRIAYVGHTQFPSKFQKTLKRIYLKNVEWNTIMPLSHYVECPNNIDSLLIRIKTPSILHPAFVLHNISKLTLHMPRKSASRKIALNAIRNCPSLREVTIIDCLITRSWFHLFKRNVKKVRLWKLRVDSALEKQLGQNIDRSLLFFCCEQWESVELFCVTDSESHGYVSRSCYACVPVRRMEWMRPKQCTNKKLQSMFAPNEWNCRSLRIHKMEAPIDCTGLIPSSVEDLFIDSEELDKTNFLLEDLLCDPSKLKHLTLKQFLFDPLPPLELGSFHAMVSLCSLKIYKANATQIAIILTGCTCLEKLTFGCSGSRLFEKIPADVVSHSVIHIEIKDGDDELENIMKHVPRVKRVRLWHHSFEAMKQIDPGLVGKLNFFSLDTKHDELLCQTLSKVDLPYLAFYYSALNDRIRYYLGNDVDSVRKQDNGVYGMSCAVRGFSTRFMLRTTITSSL